MRLVTNIVGATSARRFRKRFGLSAISESYDRYGVTGDAHDYLHTVTGTLPGPLDDELVVLALEEAIILGDKPLPRGLELVAERSR